MNGSIRPGDVIDAAAPRGDFVLDDNASPVVLVAVSIGVTPVLAMLHLLVAERSGRDVWWLHAARSTAELPFSGEIRNLLTALPHVQEHTHLLQRSRSGFGRGSTVRARSPQAAGLAPARIHTETFSTLTPITPGITDATPSPAPHTLRAPRHGARR